MLRKWTVYLSAVVLQIGIMGFPVSAQDGDVQPGWTTYTAEDGVPAHPPTRTPEGRATIASIMTIAVAPDNTLWFGTLDGLAHFDGEIWTIYTEADGLASNCILSMSFSPDGMLWVAASSWSPAFYPLCTQGGVSRFDGGSWITYTEQDGLPVADAYYGPIATTPDGIVWVGINDEMWQFDGTTWVSVRPDTSAMEHYEGLSSMAVASDGTLWVGGNYGYYKNIWLARFDGTTWTTFTPDDGLLHGGVESIAVAPDGTVWVINSGLSPTERDGVSRFNGEIWTVYTTEDHPALEGTYSVATAPDGTVWIAAADHGALHFDGETWTQFTIEDGLASNYVTTVTVAPDSAVWFGTSAGVSRYVPPR